MTRFEPTAESTDALCVSIYYRMAGAADCMPIPPRFLTPVEEASCARFLRPEDAELCREARFLVRHTLSSQLSVAPGALRFRLGQGGKPELLDTGVNSLRFNLSHSRSLAILAVTAAHDVELGIDVEHAGRQVSNELVHAALAPSELSALLALPTERRSETFLRLWTRKESVLKAAGLGLAIPPEQVVFDVGAMSLTAVPAELGEADDYSVCSIVVPGPYFASLAVLDRKRRVVTAQLQPTS